MSVPTDQLIGRADELGSFEAILEGLDGRTACAVELVGEPGIGKTRLLRELAARAESRRHLVLSGSCSELEHDLPFSLFVDALDEYVEGLEPAQLATLPDDARAELGRVLPSLASVEPGAATFLQDERYRTHRAVRALLEQLAEAGPLVLILDDAHWADPASVELLEQCANSAVCAVALVLKERCGARFDRRQRGRFLPSSARACRRKGRELRRAFDVLVECIDEERERQVVLELGARSENEMSPRLGWRRQLAQKPRLSDPGLADQFDGACCATVEALEDRFERRLRRRAR